MSGLSSETDLRQRDGLLVTDSGLLNQDTESRIRGGYKSTASVYSKVSANLVDHAHIEFVKKQTHIILLAKIIPVSTILCAERNDLWVLPRDNFTRIKKNYTGQQDKSGYLCNTLLA